METGKFAALLVGLLVFCVPVGIVTMTSSEDSLPTPVSVEMEAPEGRVSSPSEEGRKEVKVPTLEAMEKAARKQLVRKPSPGTGSGPKVRREVKVTTREQAASRRRGLAARAMEESEFQWTPPARRHLKPREVAFLLKDAGFPTSAIPRLVCTAKYESLFDTRAKNENRNGSRDTGLFQINDIWLKECGVSRAQLMDPEVNAACARKVFKEHGYWAWYAYRKKEDECKNYRLSARTMAIIGAR